MHYPSSPSGHDMNPRLIDLLIKRATEGLTVNEQHELDQLATDPRELEIFEATVAAADQVYLAQSSQNDSMPAKLRHQVEREAETFFESSEASNKNRDRERAAPASPRPTRSGPAAGPSVGPPVTRREIVSMLIAAACLLLVFSGYNPMAFDADADQGASSVQQRFVEFTQRPPADLVDLPWVPVADEDASGKVLWSDKEQTGFMVFDELDYNDPQQRQYQLWIFDTDPAQEHPVNGGVFDVTAESFTDSKGRIIIPIDARIPVRHAVQFAVTEEVPGGVVVSDREVIPVLAKLNEI